MRKKNLTKAVETTVAPNPKEVDIWVEPKDDDTVSLKYYDYHDDEWKGSSDDGSSSGSGVPQYYKVDRNVDDSNLELYTVCHEIVGACALIRIEWYGKVCIETNGRFIYGLWDSGGNFGRDAILNYTVGLCFIPCKMKTSETDELKQYNTLEEFAAAHDVVDTSFLVPISEEEFYSPEFFYPES